PPRVAHRLPRRGHAGRGTPLVPAACCRPFMTERSPAGGRLHLLAAPVLARPQEPRAALVQQLTHPAPPRSWTASRDSKRRFEAVTRGRRSGRIGSSARPVIVPEATRSARGRVMSEHV